MAVVPPVADTQYVAYKGRFVVLALFSCSTALSAFMWICFSAIFATAQQRYDATTLDINALSMTYMIAYLPGSFIALYITERYGLRMNLIAAALFNCACALTRYGGNFWPSPRGAFGVVLLGQLLGLLANPLC
jgi:fucose permease